MENENQKAEIEELREELLQVKEDSEHLKRQVMMAVNLRFHLMPNVFPVFADVPEVDIYADQISMADVGGDFYDIFRIDADHIGILIADVFDGGDAAALFMVAFKIYLQGELPMGFSAGKLMKLLNTRLTKCNEDNLSLSAWYGVYEISTGKIRAVNAGHEAPLLLKNGSVAVCPEDEKSFLMGIFEGMDYTEYEMQLNPGDALVLYTDGLLKAKNNDGELYTVENIMDVISDSHDKDAEGIVAALQKDLLAYAADTPLTDDASILCLIRNKGER